MTDPDIHTHPDQLTYRDLFSAIELAGKYLATPSAVLDDELLERLVSACDDAIRFHGQEHAEMPPEWLAGLARLFVGMRARLAAQLMMTSSARH